MAIVLTGAGGLFTRLGRLAGLVNAINAYRGGDSAGQLVYQLNGALAEVDGDTDAIRAALAPLATALTNAQGASGSFLRIVRAAANNLLITQVNADTKLAALDVPHALAVLKTQMLAGGDYVSPNTVSSSTAAAAGNAGNGAIAVGLRDAEGYQLDNLLAEPIAVTVTGNSTAGSETLLFAGAAAIADRLSQAWPGGSGASKSLTSLDPALGGNLVANGSFDAFAVANTPDSWTIAVGAAGTEVLSSTSVHRGTHAVKFAGGTGLLTSLTQALTTLASRTPYAVCLWCENDVNPAAGALALDLYNGTSVIQDEAGNNCSLSIDLTTLGTSYKAFAAVWQLADPLPASVMLRLHLTTAISAGSNTTIDSLALQAATRLSKDPGDAPWVGVFDGSANWSLKDALTLTTVNNRTCKWQQAFDQLFLDGPSGFVLPTSGTTLIADSLIA